MLDEHNRPVPIADRAALSALGRRRHDTFALPESGLIVRFQSLSEIELSEYDNAPLKRDDENDKVIVDEEVQKTSRARLIILCLVDDDGKRILTDSDLDWVCSWDPKDTLPLSERLRDFCGITDAVERRRRREAAKKN